MASVQREFRGHREPCGPFTTVPRLLFSAFSNENLPSFLPQHFPRCWGGWECCQGVPRLQRPCRGQFWGPSQGPGQHRGCALVPQPCSARCRHCRNPRAALGRSRALLPPSRQLPADVRLQKKQYPWLICQTHLAAQLVQRGAVSSTVLSHKIVNKMPIGTGTISCPACSGSRAGQGDAVPLREPRSPGRTI